MSPIAIMFSLPVEAKPLYKRAGIAGIQAESKLCEGRIGRTALVTAVSGAGPDRASQTAKLLLSVNPSAMIIAGFCGALHCGLVGGDVVTAESVVDITDEAEENYLCDGRLLKAASQEPQQNKIIHKLLTAGNVAASAEDKHILWDRYRCEAVDMESGPAAAAAMVRSIPFIVVRAVVDEYREAMPDTLIAALRPDGGVNVQKFAVGMLRDKNHLRAALLMGRRSALAARNLSEFLIDYVAGI